MSLLDRTRSRLLIEHKVTSPRLKIAKKGTMTKTKPIKIFLYCGVVTSCIFCQLIPHLSFKFWSLIPKLLQNLIPDPVNFYDPWIQSGLDKLRILYKNWKKSVSLFYLFYNYSHHLLTGELRLVPVCSFELSCWRFYHADVPLKAFITINVVINF